MRRRRSSSIMADSMEEYLKESEKEEDEEDEKDNENNNDDEDYDCKLTYCKDKYNLEEDNEYGGLCYATMGDTGLDSDNYSEDELESNIQKNESDINKIKDEEAVMIICNFLRNDSLKRQNNDDKKGLKLKSFISANSIINVNLNDVISKIFEDHLHENSTTIYDEKIKVLFVSNSINFLNKCFFNLFGIENSIQSNIVLNIYNKVEKIFNKKFCIESMVTNLDFHKKQLSYIYYQLADGYFIFIDFSCNYKQITYEIYLTITKYSKNKPIFIFSINYTDQYIFSDSKINIIHFKIDRTNFNMENDLVKHLLSLLIIKKINKEPTKSYNNNIGYSFNDELSPKDNYRTNYFTALDNINTKNTRKYNEV